MVELAGISHEPAAQLAEQAPLSVPADDITTVGSYSHEHCCFWAMHICYGHRHWQKAIPTQAEDMDADIKTGKSNHTGAPSERTLSVEMRGEICDRETDVGTAGSSEQNQF